MKNWLAMLLAAALLPCGPAAGQPVPTLEKPKSREDCNAFYAQYLRLIPSDVANMTREQQDWHASVVEARRNCWQSAEGGKPGPAPAAAATPAQPGAAVISSMEELESR